MDLDAIMNMARDFKEKLPEQLAKMAITGTAGGGAVRVIVNGKKEITNIEIAPNAPKDNEVLADLLLAAVNGAYTQADKEVAQVLPSFLGDMGGMDISSLMDFLPK